MLFHLFVSFFYRLYRIIARCLKPQPVLLSFDAVGPTQRNSESKSRFMFFQSVLNNFSGFWRFYLLSHDTNELPFSLRRSIRGKIRPHNTEQSSHSLLCATVAANQAIWSPVCFNWVMNNRWVLNNSPMDTMCSRSVLQWKLFVFTEWISIVYLSVEVMVTILRSPF